MQHCRVAGALAILLISTSASLFPSCQQQSQRLAWQHKFNTHGILAVIQATPAGEVLVGTGRGNLHCLSANGRTRWKLNLGITTSMDFITGIGCGSQGQNYMASKFGEVFSISSSGKLAWQIKLPAKYSIASLTGIDQVGNIYVMTCIEPALHVIDSNGKLITSTAVRGFHGAGLKTGVTASAGTTYAVVGGANLGERHLIALDTAGKEIWRSECREKLQNPPRVGPNGSIYLAANSAGLLAYNADGVLAWQVATGTNAPLAMADDGTIYACGADAIRAYDPDGTLRWECRQEIGTQYPAVAADGTIYCVVTYCPPGVLAVKDELTSEEIDKSYEYYLAAISPSGILMWREQLPTFTMKPLIVGSDGTVYVYLEDGRLLAYRE